MKNEGWGIKEDQIPSSSHSLHQTMGSQLHILNSYVMTSTSKYKRLEHSCSLFIFTPMVL